MTEIGYVANLEFLCAFLAESEAKDFTIVKACSQIGQITEKLEDLENTGNMEAKIA